jgi:hypothetical protein
MRLREGGSLKTTQNQTRSSIFKSPSWARGAVGQCWANIRKELKLVSVSIRFSH